MVTSAAGFPLDQTYYQTVKGMVTPLDILAPGGTLIVASDCSEGLGSKSFRDSQRRLVELGPDGFLQSILPKPLAGIDEWQTEMQLKALRAGRVQLFTRGLPAADHGLTGVEIVPDLDRAIDAGGGRLRRAGRRLHSRGALRHPQICRGMTGMESRPATIILDPIGGISGDMFLAGVLDAWPELAEPVLAAIRESLPAGCEVSIEARASGDLPCVRPSRSTANAVAADRQLRRLPRSDRQGARARRPARQHALEMLKLLAEAEAAVHRVPVERVHFHELADWDTQADLVGAAMAIDLLDGAVLALPAAAARVGHGALGAWSPCRCRLRRWPSSSEGSPFATMTACRGERVTPTGAAILRYLGAE